MSTEIARLRVAHDGDVFAARHSAREVAVLLAFDATDQVRIATVVSELGRVITAANTTAIVTLLLSQQPDSPANALVVDIVTGSQVDASPATAIGMAIAATKRLMTTVTVADSDALQLRATKTLPARHRRLNDASISALRAELSRRQPPSLMEELRAQNLELLNTLEELTVRQDELETLNAELQETNTGVLVMYTQLSDELEETNRGVVALYAEIDERGAQLREASQSKSRFLANVSHELRSPLNSIIALSELLLDKDSDPLTSDQNEQVGYIRTSADSLLAMTNELLDHAKAEAGSLTPQIQAVDLALVFGDLRATMRPITPVGVELAFDLPQPAPTLHSDAVLLAQMLRNLISNALKFTRSGAVKVTAKLAPDNMIAFSVSDTGIGIAPDQLGLIFEEFFQIPGPQQIPSRGTGLGLPYAKLIARSLGGSLDVTSTAGEGSTFVATVATNTSPTTDEITPDAGPESQDPHLNSVLLVDDDPAFRLVLSNLLRDIADEIIEADSAVDAIALLEHARPDLIFLDLRMPGGGGQAVLSAASELEQLRDIPVVVVTSADLHAPDVPPLDRAAAVISKSGLTRPTLIHLIHSIVNRNDVEQRH